MSEITSKETLLKRVRQALVEKTKNPFPDLELDSPIYREFDADLAVEFAENFTQAKGSFIYNIHIFEAVDNFITLHENKRWSKLVCKDEVLAKRLTDTGIEFQKNHKSGDFVDAFLITCECLVSKTGSIVISTKQTNIELTDESPCLVVFAYTHQIVREMKDVFNLLKNRYGNNPPRFVKWLTGPAVENTIEMMELPGFRGPVEIFLFLIDEK
ncbi:MAG: LUD domain-containing protein [Bacteroidota bacterium]|nr:LUD domain-containing protein [Bacteroidota bacterium]